MNNIFGAEAQNIHEFVEVTGTVLNSKISADRRLGGECVSNVDRNPKKLPISMFSKQTIPTRRFRMRRIPGQPCKSRIGIAFVWSETNAAKWMPFILVVAKHCGDILGKIVDEFLVLAPITAG
jgi:hypothetical protein